MAILLVHFLLRDRTLGGFPYLPCAREVLYIVPYTYHACACAIHPLPSRPTLLHRSRGTKDVVFSLHLSRKKSQLQCMLRIKFKNQQIEQKNEISNFFNFTFIVQLWPNMFLSKQKPYKYTTVLVKLSVFQALPNCKGSNPA